MSTSGPPPGGSPGASGQAANPAPRACYRHPDRPTYVSCVRCERPICAECMRPAAVGFQCPDDVADGHRQTGQQRPLRTSFGGRQTGGRPYVTLTFLALNVLAFIAQGFPLSQNTAPNHFTLNYVDDNFDIASRHEYYRLLTGAFLHVAIWHIAVNMLVLMLVGPALEAMLGRLRYIALYLLSAIGGGVLVYLVKDIGYASLGASGAIFGLFAGYWVLARRVRADTSAITGTIVLNLIISVTFPGISLWGHLGGLITGALVGAVLAFSPPRRWQIQLGGLVAVAAILVVATLIRTSSLT
jgi:membrane associated rhomboid family serine protease